MTVSGNEEEGAASADAGKRRPDGRVKFEKVTSESSDMVTL